VDLSELTIPLRVRALLGGEFCGVETEVGNKGSNIVARHAILKLDGELTLLDAVGYCFEHTKLGFVLATVLHTFIHDNGENLVSFEAAIESRHSACARRLPLTTRTIGLAEGDTGSRGTVYYPCDLVFPASKCSNYFAIVELWAATAATGCAVATSATYFVDLAAGGQNALGLNRGTFECSVVDAHPYRKEKQYWGNPPGDLLTIE